MDKGKLYANILNKINIEKPSHMVEDMKLTEKVFDLGLLKLLDNPLLEGEKKVKIITRILGRHVKPETLHFLEYLIKEGDLGQLKKVRQAYERILAQQEKVVNVEVVSAVPLTAELLDSISVNLGKKIKKNLTISNKIDPELIGGVAIRIGDKNYDNTLSRRISDLQRKLAS
jgi:F-type H+-transporting ATPase subunit delta